LQQKIGQRFFKIGQNFSVGKGFLHHLKVCHFTMKLTLSMNTFFVDFAQFHQHFTT